MLEEILKKVDEKLLTPELKADLVEAFDKAIDEKAETKASSLLEAKEKEYNESLNEMIETVSKTISVENQEKFNEAVEAKVEEITEATKVELEEKYLAESKKGLKALEEKMVKYLEHAAQEFVTESMPKWQQEADVLKAGKIQEEFVLMTEAFSGKLAKVETQDEINESIEKKVLAIKELNEKVVTLTKEKMIKEAKEGLSVVKQDKLDTLLESVAFVSEDAFASKIELYKSALVEKEAPKKKIEEKQETPKIYKRSW